ncbi:MAG: hypothetical protein LLG04_13455 [Parachlamydia sp.]|nr:hypothetical protein [Parachlamydia sp.]
MKQKLLLLTGCALLLLPSTLPAKSPKGQHPDHVEPKVLVDQAKKELQKEIQTVRQEVEKVRKELNGVRQEVGVVGKEVGVVRQEVGVIQQEVDVVQQEVDVVRQDVGVVRQDVVGIKNGLIRAHAYSFLKDRPVTVKDRDPIPFTSNELRDSPILCHDGAFILPYNGTYIVNFGVITQGEIPAYFELQQTDKSVSAGKAVTGGKLFTAIYESSYGIGSLVVMISADAGDQLKIVNVTGQKVTFSEKSNAPAYITILHVQH